MNSYMSNVKGNDIKVAIKCLVYNHEPYLRECLEGFVMQQTDFPFVAIVHDDASTDHSADIIREYAAKYPDIIHPIYETENQYSKKGSLTKIMNDAIEATGAPYIALCEGDDYWTDPHKLQKQVDFLDTHPEVGLCYTDYGKCANTNKPYILGAFTNGAAVPPKDYEEFLLENSYIAPMTWMYRRDVWKNLDLDWVRTDGTLVWALEFYMKSKVAYLPDITAIYREHWGSASKPVNEKGFFRQYKGVLDTELEFVGRYRERVPKELEDKIRSKGYIDLLPHALLANEGEFIEEVRNYFEGKGIHFQQLLSMAEQLNVARAQASHAWNSKAYKLGRAILNPIKRLRRK